MKRIGLRFTLRQLLAMAALVALLLAFGGGLLARWFYSTRSQD